MLPTLSSMPSPSLVLIDDWRFLQAFVCVSRQNETTPLNKLDNDKLLACVCVLCFPAVLITRGTHAL